MGGFIQFLFYGVLKDFLGVILQIVFWIVLITVLPFYFLDKSIFYFIPYMIFLIFLIYVKISLFLKRNTI